MTTIPRGNEEVDQTYASFRQPMEILQHCSLFYRTTTAVFLPATKRRAGFASWELFWESWIHVKGAAGGQNLNAILHLKLGNPVSQETPAFCYGSKLLNSASTVNIYLTQTSFCWWVNFSTMLLRQAVPLVAAWSEIQWVLGQVVALSRSWQLPWDNLSRLSLWVAVDVHNL